ncbi:MAG: bifunctional precorrin-2 dehydrogenase/sirohydrochlorin ferrochelatase [Actinomycetota bacterium]
MTTRVAPARPAGPGKSWYPAFLDVEGRRVLVVGGGPVATDKTATLVEHGARVRLVSPLLTDALAAMVADGTVHEHRARRYEPGDIEGCFLAISATGDAAVDRGVWEDAERRGIPINVPGAPPLCSFLVPSTLRRGGLAIAVSTGGASPVVARRVRRDLEALYGPEWEEFLALLHDLRDEMKARYPEAGDRRGAVERLMDTDVLARLAGRDADGARALVRAALGAEETA